MLNTLNHNQRVNQKMKMSETQFVKQCKDVAPCYKDTAEMYYRVCKREYQTDTQDIEKAFERIMPFVSIDLHSIEVKDSQMKMVQAG